jgi:tetratricopeptide (TPR) repeat protein
MAQVTFFRKIWTTIKPPPAVPKKKQPLTSQQRKMIRISAAVLVVLGGGLGIYYWIASAPDRAEVQFQAGMKLMQPGHYPEAVREFGRAISSWDGHAQAYLQRGIARQILGDTDNALADFEKAAQVDPGLAEAFTARGTILRDRGNVRAAIDEFTKSIGLRATMDGYYQRGQLWERLGEHQKAIDDYDRAIAEERDAPYVYSARGISRRALGDVAGYEHDRDTASSLEHKH